MLEVKDGTGKNTAADKPSVEIVNAPQQFKVVIEEDEFKKNLEQHRLKEKIKTIEKQKIDIKMNIKNIKNWGYLQIAVGLIIILFALKKYLIPQVIDQKYVQNADGVDLLTTMQDKEMTSLNYGILVVLVSIFGYLYFSGKNKGKK